MGVTADGGLFISGPIWAGFGFYSKTNITACRIAPFYKQTIKHIRIYLRAPRPYMYGVLPDRSAQRGLMSFCANNALHASSGAIYNAFLRVCHYFVAQTTIEGLAV